MVSTVLGFARHPAFGRALPIALFIAFIAAAGPIEDLARAIGVDPRWGYAVRTLLVAAALGWFWRSYGELRSIAGVRAADWLLAVVVGVVLFVLWINLTFPPLSFGNPPGFDAHTDGVLDWRFALPRLAGAVLVVPVMEELFWRSLVMRWIQNHDFLVVPPARVGLKALAISSVLFGLEHHLWFAGILAGLVYGWLYIRTGNIWVPILSHAVTNGVLGAWVVYTKSWVFW